MTIKLQPLRYPLGFTEARIVLPPSTQMEIRQVWLDRSLTICYGAKNPYWLGCWRIWQSEPARPCPGMCIPEAQMHIPNNLWKQRIQN